MDPATPDMGAEAELEHEAAKPRVRDRIFEKACSLFYRHGIHAVGVDSIATEAGTNKMSFYRAFPSKAELVAEYLREQERCVSAFWQSVVDAHPGDARAAAEALFDKHVQHISTSESRGCAMANAAVELSEEGHPAREVIEHHKSELRRRFRALARDMGAREPDTLGDALMLVWEGSFLTRLTFPTRGPALNAAKAARALIAAYVP